MAYHTAEKFGLKLVWEPGWDDDSTMMWLYGKDGLLIDCWADKSPVPVTWRIKQDSFWLAFFN